MKNLILLMILAVLALSCKNDVPVAPASTPAPIEKPKKNDVPNSTPIPEKSPSGSGISDI